MPTLYVVRHAHAGSRSAWTGPDTERPLSPRGRREAAAIADLLAERGVTRLVSSPAVRCTQTFGPLGDKLGLAVEAERRLQEGTGGPDVVALVAELCNDGRDRVALCSHGDVIPELLRALAAEGTRFADPLTWPKASTWVVTREGGRWTEACYIPPPRG